MAKYQDSQSARPLIVVLSGAFILLGLVHAMMFSRWDPPKALPDLPWVVPVTNAMVMLSAWSVALLSFGRYAVRRDIVSFWTGLAFAALATCQMFYVLTWPGLLPEGRAIVGNLPSTAAWIAMLTLSLPGISLLAAVWARWPGPGALEGKRWLWLVGGCLMCLVLVNVGVVVLEESLPALVEASGHFTPLLQVLQWLLTVTFGLGAVASARYYVRKGDTLPGYTALTQLFLFFFELAIVLGGTRYSHLFFADRFLVIGGFVAMLFGLLLDYVKLHGKEVERTRELERSAEELRKSEERYREFFHDDLTGDVISTPEGRILLCNPAFARMFGFSSVEEAVGTNVVNLYVDGAERKPLMERVRSEGKIERLEVWRKRRDGTQIHIVENLVGHFDERGELFEIKGYLFDDTERKRAEEALRESEKRFATLVEQAPVGIFETDAQGECIFVNDGWQALAGLTASEAAGKGWMRAIHPEDRERVGAEWYAAAQGQREFISEYRFRTPNGRISWVMGRAKPIQDGAGGVVRHLGTLLDITERKRAEQLEVLEDVFRLAPSFLHVLRGPKFIFEFANEAYYGLVGHRDLIGQPAFEAMPESAEGGYPDRIARVMETGEAFFGRELPVTLERTPGAKPEKRIIDLVYVPLKEADGTCTGVLGHGTDVTEHVQERRRAEEALREERDFSAAVLETAGALVVVLDTAGRIRRFNRACAALTGYAEEEVLGRPVWFLIPPEDVPGVREEWNALSSGNVNSRHENYWLARDGTRRLIAWSNTVLMGASGELLHVIGTGLDITERRRAEEAVREKAEELSAVLDTAPVAVWVAQDRECRVITGNAYADELIMGTARGANISRSAAPGEAVVSYRVFRDGVELESHELPAQRATATGKPVPAFEMELVFPNGRRLNLLAGAVPLFDAEGSVRGAIVAGLDVTTLRKAQEDVRESEEHFRSITDTTPVIMWMTDANGVMEFVNRAYGEFFGVTLEQVAGPGGWQPVVHPDDAGKYVGAYMAALKNRSEFREETRVRRADGQWRWIQSYGSPRFDEKGEFLGMAGSSPDITERKEFEAELERLVVERTSKLKELVGELEHFSYTITHDLKSPLRAMRGFAELAGEICEEGEYGRTKEFLGRISTAAERMDNLIADALSYSRAVRQELPLEDVDSGALLRGMLDSYPELQSEKARICVEGRLPVVLANQAGLTQCFSNLLGNAVKFVKQGQMPEIRIWAEQREGRARIWVEDNGIGIAKEMLPRMFEMFARGSKDYEGTGIGLALVRKVAQRMGGLVGVESEEGKGSRFWIELKCGEALGPINRSVRDQGPVGRR